MENILSGIINYNFFKVVLTLVFIICLAVMGKGIFTEIIPELSKSIKEKNRNGVVYYSKFLLISVLCVCISGYSTNLLLNSNVDTNKNSVFNKGV